MKNMRIMIPCLAGVLAVFLTVQSACTQNNKLEGVWRITEVTLTGANPVKIDVTPAHANLIIFTKKHFSFMNLMTRTDTRLDLPTQNATAEQKVAAWTPVAAFSGTYEVKGNIFTNRNIVDKDPNGMAPGNFTTNEFKIEGNTLTTTPKTDQNGPIANPIITKFVRVE
jgi:hypothetical protein